MRIVALLFVFAAILTPPAAGQPLPNTIRSSELTRAQADELNTRLNSLQGRFAALARETSLRESAIRNIAVEIFGAQPDLSFATYADLIESGARELQDYLVSARDRDDIDPVAAALRQRAIAAAEAGRLAEGRALYDELIAVNLETRTRSRRGQDMADAADIAESAGLALAAADHRDAARRFAQAATLAPSDSRERWLYTKQGADALRLRGYLFGDSGTREAIEIYRHNALPLVREYSVDWIVTQRALAQALSTEGFRSGGGHLNEAIAIYRRVLTRQSRTTDGSAWASTQEGLAFALYLQGYRNLGGHDAAQRNLQESAAAFRAALTVRSRVTDPQQWASTQTNLGLTLQALGGEQSDRDAIAAFRAALEIVTRTGDPTGWAEIQNNLGLALVSMGNRGDLAAAREAVSVYGAASEVLTRATAPASWAAVQHNLGNALFIIGREGDRNALAQAVGAYEAALLVRDRTRAPEDWATTQFTLGKTHLKFVELQDRTHLPEARAAFAAALEGFQLSGNEYWADLSRQWLTYAERL